MTVRDLNECDDEERESCWFCGGDGWVFGYDLDDPLWYDDDEVYPCEVCGGSGDAEDCTVW